MQPIEEYLRFTLALFAVLTPFAAIPTFLALTDGQTSAERGRTAFTAGATVAIVLVVAALIGDFMLNILGTSLDAFRVGGGAVLFLMALAMLNAKVSPVRQTREEVKAAEQREAVGVVPLGIPLIAGPGSISTAIIEAQKSASLLHVLAVIGCIGLVCVLVWQTLRLAEPIGSRLGVIGLNISTRIFGLIVAAIAVQVMANGLKGLLPGLAIPG